MSTPQQDIEWARQMGFLPPLQEIQPQPEKTMFAKLGEAIFGKKPAQVLPPPTPVNPDEEWAKSMGIVASPEDDIEWGRRMGFLPTEETPAPLEESPKNPISDTLFGVADTARRAVNVGGAGILRPMVKAFDVVGPGAALSLLRKAGVPERFAPSLEKRVGPIFDQALSEGPTPFEKKHGFDVNAPLVPFRGSSAAEKTKAFLVKTGLAPESKIVRGAGAAVEPTVDTIAGLTTPTNLALLALGIKSPALSRAVAASFVPGMAEGTVEGTKQAVEGARERDLEKTVKGVAGAGISGAFTYGAGKHALSPKVPFAKEVPAGRIAEIEKAAPIETVGEAIKQETLSPRGEEYITVYHRTNMPVDAIREKGFKSAENTKEIFVSTEKSGQASDYGENVIPLRVKRSDLRLDDEFPSGEQHFAIKSSIANRYLGTAGEPPPAPVETKPVTTSVENPLVAMAENAKRVATESPLVQIASKAKEEVFGKEPLAPPVKIEGEKPERLTSRVFDRLKYEQDKFPTPEHPLSGNVTYEKITMAREAENAVNLINQDKQKAYRVAMGAEHLPDQTSTGVNIAMAEKALEEGNHKLYGQLVKKRSLDQTRRGQEIVMEKMSINDNSPARYVKELVSTRLEKMGTPFLSKARDVFAKESKSKRSMRIIDEQVVKAQKQLGRNRLDIVEAQALLDRLACK